MKKLLILFAIALFALLFASCSDNSGDPSPTSPNSQGNGNAAGCFEGSEQIIEKHTRRPYMANGNVYMADKRDNLGQPILTEESMLLVGKVNNGKITFNCPENVDSNFLMELREKPGREVEPLGVKAWFYTDPFRLIKNGDYIGDIRYEKRPAREFHEITYIYSTSDFKASGWEGSMELEINAKKGWNKTYYYMREDLQSEDRFSGFATTDLSEVPDGLEWVIDIDIY